MYGKPGKQPLAVGKHTGLGKFTDNSYLRPMDS